MRVFLLLCAILFCIAIVQGQQTTGRKSLTCSQSSLASCRCRKKNVVTCDKADCMNKMPTGDISLDDRRKITSLRIVNQKDLTEISNEDLRGLTNLVYAKIAKNNIATIGNNAFDDLQNLKKLDLHANKLTSVPHAISRLPNLEQLNLGANGIKRISNSELMSNTNLLFLILRNNELTDFPATLPRNIRKLSLVHNKIRSVGDVRHLNQLQLLRLDGNELTSIPNAQNNISSNVEELTLCSNEITADSINRVDALQGLTKLRKLRLAGNKKISTVSSNFLRSASGLRELDMSECGISHIASDAFACASQLQYIGLNGNNLQEYDGAWVVNNRRLRVLHLSKNPWRCTCEMVKQLNDLEDEVGARIERVLRKHGDDVTNSLKFKNDFNLTQCSEVEEDLQEGIDAETSRHDLTQYRDASCVGDATQWKFQKRRESCEDVKTIPQNNEQLPIEEDDEVEENEVGEENEAEEEETEEEIELTRPTTRRQTTTTSTTTTTTTTTQAPTTTTEEQKTCTKDGKRCVLPWIDDGVSYNSCKWQSGGWLSSGYYWCLNDVDAGSWSYCWEERCVQD